MRQKKPRNMSKKCVSKNRVNRKKRSNGKNRGKKRKSLLGGSGENNEPLLSDPRENAEEESQMLMGYIMDLGKLEQSEIDLFSRSDHINENIFGTRLLHYALMQKEKLNYKLEKYKSNKKRMVKYNEKILKINQIIESILNNPSLDVNTLDMKGQTALQIAQDNGEKEIYLRLLKLGEKKTNVIKHP